MDQIVFYDGPSNAKNASRSGGNFYPELEPLYCVLNAVNAPSDTIGVMFPFLFCNSTKSNREFSCTILTPRPNLSVARLNDASTKTRHQFYRKMSNSVSSSIAAVVLGTTTVFGIPCIPLNEVVYFCAKHLKRMHAYQRLRPLGGLFFSTKTSVQLFESMIDDPPRNFYTDAFMCPIWAFPACLAQFGFGLWADLAHRQIHAQLSLSVWTFPEALAKMPPIEWPLRGNLFFYGEPATANHLHDGDLRLPKIELISRLKNHLGLSFSAVSLLVPIRVFCRKGSTQPPPPCTSTFEDFSVFCVDGPLVRAREIVRKTARQSLGSPSTMLLTALPERVYAKNGACFVCPVVPLSVFQFFVAYHLTTTFREKLKESWLFDNEWLFYLQPNLADGPVVPIWAAPRVLESLGYPEFVHEWFEQVRSQMINRRGVYPTGWMELQHMATK